MFFWITEPSLFPPLPSLFLFSFCQQIIGKHITLMDSQLMYLVTVDKYGCLMKWTCCNRRSKQICKREEALEDWYGVERKKWCEAERERRQWDSRNIHKMKGLTAGTDEFPFKQGILEKAFTFISKDILLLFLMLLHIFQSLVY